MSEGAAEDRMTLAIGSSEGTSESWQDSMRVQWARILTKPAFLFLSLCAPALSFQPSTPSSQPLPLARSQRLP